MKPIANKFRYGLMIRAIALALALPLAANSAPCDCQGQDDHASSTPPEFLTMHNEMMLMQPGMLSPPPGVMMLPPPFSINGEFIPPLPPSLNLSESQQDKIFELLHSQEPTVRAQHRAVHKALAEMKRLATSDHYSPPEVRPLADKLAKAIADTLVLRTATKARIRALLTPEQRKQADGFEANFAHD